MVDWSASMTQTYEFYIVDPGTWKDKQLLNTVKTAKINRDATVETLGSATIDVTETIGECYIRIYIITNQNGVTEKHPLGTFLAQTPSTSFDGKVKEISMDAYTPLIELKEKLPPIGYYIPKGEDVLYRAFTLVRENARAPVVDAKGGDNPLLKVQEDYIAETEDTQLSYIRDLLSSIKYKLDLDDMSRVIFVPDQDTESLQAVWTYDDNNSSILYPELTMDHDLYGIPNVVEVIYTNGSDSCHCRILNDDENSPTSIQRRGREIIHRVTDPGFTGIPTKEQVEEYAKTLLKELSTIEYTVSYTHGYCPVRVGDCVRLNYSRAGLTNVKAKVISQSIECTPGCPVSETAIFTKKLWR